MLIPPVLHCQQRFEVIYMERNFAEIGMWQNIKREKVEGKGGKTGTLELRNRADTEKKGLDTRDKTSML